MSAPTLDFEMYVADTKVLRIGVVDGNAAVFDLTSCTIRWQMSKVTSLSPYKFSATPLLQKAIGTGITVTDAPNGALDISIASADTKTLKPGPYYYELEVVDSAGDVQTVLTGTITLLPALITN